MATYLEGHFKTDFIGRAFSMNTVTIGAELEYQCRGLPIPTYFQVRSWTVESS